MSWAVTWILIRFKSNSNHETSHWVLLSFLAYSPFAFQDRVTCLALTRECINQCTLGYRVQFIGRCLALSPLA